MELVHGHEADGGVLPFPQRTVGQDLRRAADHGSTRVDGGVAGDHAHVVLAQKSYQLEELFADQGFNGRGVVGDAAAQGKGPEVQAQSHQGLARARRRAQDHVVACHQVHQSFLLMGPGGLSRGLRPIQIGHEHVVEVRHRLLVVQLVCQSPQGPHPVSRGRRLGALLGLFQIFHGTKRLAFILIHGHTAAFPLRPAPVPPSRRIRNTPPRTKPAGIECSWTLFSHI